MMKKWMLAAISLAWAAPAENIKDIRIVDAEGRLYDISSVKAYTSFEAGDQAPERAVLLSTITEDVDRMRSSGRYSYVDANLLIEDDGLVVVYKVVSKQRLRRIEIRGADQLGNKKARQKSELEIGTLVDDFTFEEAAAKIRTAYRDHRYPDVRVTWRAEVDAERGTVDLLMEVDEGRKKIIRKIRFSGNEQIKDDQLRGVITQKQKNLWSLFTGAGKYHPEMIDADMFALKTLYMNNGFLDVQVSEPTLDDAKPKNSIMTFTIEEGRCYRIGEVKVSGSKTVSDEQLREFILLASGDIASYKNIEAGAESLRAYYGNRGVVRLQVNTVYNADVESGVVDVEYQVEEGLKSTIANVVITGNERTLDEVIRRELVAFPGDEYNRSLLKTSENRLRNLNYFETVSVTPEPTEKSDEYDVAVKVKEKPTGQLTAGVGLSSVDALLGYVEFSQGNFNWRKWPSVGGGQKLKVRGQLGTRRRDLDVLFIEPWFMDRKLSLEVGLYHRESRYFSDAYDQITDGLRLSLGKPISRYTRGTLAYSLENFDVYNVADTATRAIRDEAGQRLASSLEYIWSFDNRNHFFNATRGSKTTVTPYFSGGPLGGDTDIYGVRMKSIRHTPLIWDMIFTLRAQIESVESYGDSRDSSKTGDGVPIFERLFLGGSYTLRGYEFRNVGPKESTRVYSIGGNSYAFTSTELTFPLWGAVRGAVFYDWGFVNEDSWDFDPAIYNDNWGIGLRFQIPGFPLQFDYAWPINYHEDRGETGSPRFNFTLGYIF